MYRNTLVIFVYWEYILRYIPFFAKHMNLAFQKAWSHSLSLSCNTASLAVRYSALGESKKNLIGIKDLSLISGNPDYFHWFLRGFILNVLIFLI